MRMRRLGERDHAFPIWVGLALIGSVFSVHSAPPLIDVARVSNGGHVRTIYHLHQPTLGSGSILNLIDGDPFTSITGFSSGLHATLIFEFAQPARLDRIELIYGGTCALWQALDPPPKRLRMRAASGEIVEWTLTATDFPFNPVGLPFHIVLPIPAGVTIKTDRLELEVLELMGAGDGGCFRDEDRTTFIDIEIWGEPQPANPVPLQINNVTYDSANRQFRWETSRPARGNMVYYGQIGTQGNLPIHGHRVIGPGGLGNEHIALLGSDYRSGYVILRCADADGNTAEIIPDDVLHEEGLLGVPFRSPSFGLLLEGHDDLSDLLSQEGLGASNQFGHIWIRDDLKDPEEFGFYSVRLKLGLENGISPVILFAWFGMAETYIPGVNEVMPHNPFNPAESLDHRPKEIILADYYDDVRRLAELVGGLPHNERVYISLEPEWNVPRSFGFNPEWDEVQVKAIRILRDGVMPNGQIVPSAGNARIGTNIYALPDTNGALLISMPQTAQLVDYIGIHELNFPLGSREFNERLTLAAEHAFRTFLKPLHFYCPVVYSPLSGNPEFNLTGQAAMAAQFFNPQPFAADSFNVIQRYYPSNTRYRDAWDQSRMFNIVGPVFVPGTGTTPGNFDLAIMEASRFPRPIHWVWKKETEDAFDQETNSPELTAPPLFTPSAQSVLIRANYDVPVEFQVYHGVERLDGFAEFTSYIYNRRGQIEPASKNHLLRLGGLRPNTRYHARFRAIGPEGVIDASPDFVFTTLPGLDANPSANTLVTFRDPRGWAYHDFGGTPAANWTSLSFNEDGWKYGLAPFATELFTATPEGVVNRLEGRQQTTLDEGPDSANRITTYYFRARFILSAEEANRIRTTGAPALSVLYRDGFAAYLNGQRVAKINLPEPFFYFTPAGPRDEDFMPELVDITASRNQFQAGENVLALELHTQNGSIPNLAFPALFDAALVDRSISIQTIAEFNSAWRYDQSRTPLNDGQWRLLAFNDSGWLSGVGMFGYRMSDLQFGSPGSCVPHANPANFGIATVLDPGLAFCNNKTKTFYFRFNFDTPPVLPLNLYCSIRYNDGYVVYLNGVEVGRSSNMPLYGTGPNLVAEGAMTYDDLPSFATTDGVTIHWREDTLDLGNAMKTLVESGGNTLAVEMKRVPNPQSSTNDLYFDARLLLNPGPVIDDAGLLGVEALPLYPGTAQFLLEIRVKNLGTTVWSEAAGYRLSIVYDPCELAGGFSSLGLPPNVLISPGEEAIFRVNSAPGPWEPSCAIVARMMNGAGAPFGETMTSTLAPPPVQNEIDGWSKYR